MESVVTKVPYSEKQLMKKCRLEPQLYRTDKDNKNQSQTYVASSSKGPRTE